VRCRIEPDAVVGRVRTADERKSAAATSAVVILLM
jgi:hypothetical protein